MLLVIETVIDELHQEITANNYTHSRPGFEHTFYGANCAEVMDPFGNCLRIIEYLGT